MYFVYYLQDPRNSNKGYIGKTCDLKKRLALHYSPYSLKDKTIKNNWIKKLKKQGLNPLVKILATVRTNKEANRLEKYFIKDFKSEGFILVNGTPGGDGWAKGFKMPKTKARLNGAKSVMRKVILRQIETGKEFIFESIKNACVFSKVYTQNAHLVLSNKQFSAGGYYWRYFGEKFNQNKVSKTNITKIIGYNLKTGEQKIYSPGYNCRLDGFNPSCVFAVCKGKRKQHKGWNFNYA